MDKKGRRGDKKIKGKVSHPQMKKLLIGLQLQTSFTCPQEYYFKK